MRRDEHGPPARIAFLVGADDGLDELAAHDRIEAGGRLVEHEQLGLGADRGDQRELRSLALRQVRRVLARIEPEPLEQGALGRAVPARAEGREVVERLAHGHPRIERDVVGHVGDARFDGHFCLARIEPEDAHRAARWAQQVQETLDRRRLAGAVAAEEAVAAAGFDLERESVHGVGMPVAPHQPIDVDGRVVRHVATFLWRCSSKESRRSSTSLRNSARVTCR